MREAAIVGLQFRALRERLGWKQEEMASYVDVNLNTYKGWETARVDPPPHRIQAIVKRTGLDANYLLAIEGVDPWGPAFNQVRDRLRQHLQQSPPTGNTFAARASYVLRWLTQHVPFATMPFLAGLLGMSVPELQRCMAPEGDPIIGSGMEELSRFSAIPLTWFATGREEDLGLPPEELRRWEYAITRCRERGISPDDIVEHLNLIATLAGRRS